MTVKFSLDLKRKIKPCTNKVCKTCGLYLHQQPAYEKKLKPLFLGWSFSSTFDEGIIPQPLSPLTPSGSLIDSIEIPLRQDIQFYKTNIVKCVPLNTEKGKSAIRLNMKWKNAFQILNMKWKY